jgi:hypothetical protein
MAIRSGIAAQIGLAAETTWGTYVAPDHWYEFNEEDLSLSIEPIESAGIRANNRVLRTDRWAQGQKRVEGSVTMEVPTKSFGLVAKHALGAVNISTPSGATNARLHRHTLGDPYGLGLTVQVGRPDNLGTVQPFSYTGAKVSELTLTNSVDEILQAEIGIVAQNETTSQSLASASYPTGNQVFNWTQGVISIGGGAVGVVTDFEVTVNNGLKDDRYFLGAATMSQPIIANMTEITGSMTVEWSGLTDYNRFVNGTTASISAKWTAATAIEGSTFPYVEVTLANCRFDGDTPNVGGPDVITHDLTFKALYDGTNGPIVIDLMSDDTVS